MPSQGDYDQTTWAHLRKTLRIHDNEDIKSKLLKYSEMFELFDINFPDWTVQVKGENWRMRYVIAPLVLHCTMLLIIEIIL